MDNETKDDHDSQGASTTEIKYKSAKNIVGYADDAEVDPKLVKVGELVLAEMKEEDAEECRCTDDSLIDMQEKREAALAKQRITNPNT